MCMISNTLAKQTQKNVYWKEQSNQYKMVNDWKQVFYDQ